ncbi:hypothetical protein LAZ67_X001497 [Cordylochernes scorpioides]|uniref:Reverse transcriptase domain-containing protein n=1 Tax=Cordylochernes scorpioides TaxID=51811 RepID=A0ABY6LUL3_9ARAC|nr:hypothetical protein LAZ67_X001497 [Cordylochernes scorpioides]
MLHRAEERKADVICIQETKLRPEKAFKVNGYKLIRKDRTLGRGGGGLLTLENQFYFSISTTPPDKPGPELQQITHLLTNKTILIGDFNSKHPTWGCNDTNNCGEALSTSLDNTDLFCISEGHTYVSNSYGTPQTLDLVITTPQLAQSDPHPSLRGILKGAKKTIPRGNRKQYIPGYIETINSLQNEITQRNQAQEYLMENNELENKINLSKLSAQHLGHAIIIPIHKAVKTENHPQSYRPISITSIPCKLMERMILNRMQYFLNKNNFQKYHNRVDQIFYFTQKIQDNFQRKPTKSTIAAFIDLSQAFDIVWKERLIKKLDKLGIRGKMMDWIGSFLTGRTFQVNFKEQLSKTGRFFQGLPRDPY